MKKFLIVLASACLAGCGDSDAGKTRDATAFFRPYFDKVAAAWSTLDVSKPAAFYAKDANIVFFDISPLKYNGWQDFEAGSRKLFSDWSSMKFTVSPDFHATLAGNIAWATYTADLAVQPKSGNPMNMQARGTDILERRGEQWVIIHEHFSAPLAEPQPVVKAAKTKAKGGARHKGKARRK